MVLLEDISITGIRSISPESKDFQLNFGKDITILVGSVGAGKSSVIDALRSSISSSKVSNDVLTATDCKGSHFCITISYTVPSGKTFLLKHGTKRREFWDISDGSELLLKEPEPELMKLSKDFAEKVLFCPSSDSNWPVVTPDLRETLSNIFGHKNHLQYLKSLSEKQKNLKQKDSVSIMGTYDTIIDLRMDIEKLRPDFKKLKEELDKMREIKAKLEQVEGITTVISHLNCFDASGSTRDGGTNEIKSLFEKIIRDRSWSQLIQWSPSSSCPSPDISSLYTQHETLCYAINNNQSALEVILEEVGKLEEFRSMFSSEFHYLLYDFGHLARQYCAHKNTDSTLRFFLNIDSCEVKLEGSKFKKAIQLNSELLSDVTQKLQSFRGNIEGMKLEEQSSEIFIPYQFPDAERKVLEESLTMEMRDSLSVHEGIKRTCDFAKNLSALCNLIENYESEQKRKHDAVQAAENALRLAYEALSSSNAWKQLNNDFGNINITSAEGKENPLAFENRMENIDRGLKDLTEIYDEKTRDDELKAAQKRYEESIATMKTLLMQRSDLENRLLQLIRILNDTYTNSSFPGDMMQDLASFVKFPLSFNKESPVHLSDEFISALSKHRKRCSDLNVIAKHSDVFIHYLRDILKKPRMEGDLCLLCNTSCTCRLAEGADLTRLCKVFKDYSLTPYGVYEENLLKMEDIATEHNRCLDSYVTLKKEIEIKQGEQMERRQEVDLLEETVRKCKKFPSMMKSVEALCQPVREKIRLYNAAIVNAERREILEFRKGEEYEWRSNFTRLLHFYRSKPDYIQPSVSLYFRKHYERLTASLNLEISAFLGKFDEETLGSLWSKEYFVSSLSNTRFQLLHGWDLEALYSRLASYSLMSLKNSLGLLDIIQHRLNDVKPVGVKSFENNFKRKFDIFSEEVGAPILLRALDYLSSEPSLSATSEYLRGILPNDNTDSRYDHVKLTNFFRDPKRFREHWKKLVDARDLVFKVYQYASSHDSVRRTKSILQDLAEKLASLNRALSYNTPIDDDFLPSLRELANSLSSMEVGEPMPASNVHVEIHDFPFKSYDDFLSFTACSLDSELRDETTLELSHRHRQLQTQLAELDNQNVTKKYDELKSSLQQKMVRLRNYEMNLYHLLMKYCDTTTAIKLIEAAIKERNDNLIEDINHTIATIWSEVQRGDSIQSFAIRRASKKNAIDANRNINPPDQRTPGDSLGEVTESARLDFHRKICELIGINPDHFQDHKNRIDPDDTRHPPSGKFRADLDRLCDEYRKTTTDEDDKYELWGYRSAGTEVRDFPAKEQCSSGQMALISLIVRISIAIQLSPHSVLALDEPSSNLSAYEKQRLVSCLLRIMEDNSASLQLILITHDKLFLESIRDHMEDVGRNNRPFDIKSHYIYQDRTTSRVKDITLEAAMQFLSNDSLEINTV